ncbi:hypothetical protein Tco_0690055 [Tanacetum coccineum]
MRPLADKSLLLEETTTTDAEKHLYDSWKAEDPGLLTFKLSDVITRNAGLSADDLDALMTLIVMNSINQDCSHGHLSRNGADALT